MEDQTISDSGQPIGGFPARTEKDRTYCFGYGVLVVVMGFFVVAIYMTVISKIMPYTENAILDAIKDDMYYCFLLPLTIPVGVLFVYLNWMSLKFFRHN